MCRFVGYLGPPITLEALLLAPEHSLLTQAHAPRFQRHGTVNADGFGVGWYDLERRPEPAVYRSTRPIWGDRSFGSLAGLVSSTAVLAVLRDATPPAVAEESGTPPFSEGPWLFGHNGVVAGFQQGVGGALRRMLSDRRLGNLRGATDSEVLFALILDRLDAGATPAAAMTSVIRTVSGQVELIVPSHLAEVAASVPKLTGPEESGPMLDGRDASSPRPEAATPVGTPSQWSKPKEDAAPSNNPVSRMNMMLTDGRRLTATSWGDSLFVLSDEAAGAARGSGNEGAGASRLSRPGLQVIASEPFDDNPGWYEVPDRSVVEAGPGGTRIIPMDTVSDSVGGSPGEPRGKTKHI